jgi:hypothetical protein
MSYLSVVVALWWPTNFTVSLSFQYLDKYQRLRGVIGTGLAADVPDDLKTKRDSQFPQPLVNGLHASRVHQTATRNRS